MIQERVRVGHKNVKKESFVNFCNNLRKDTNPTYVQKKVKSFKNRFNFSETGNQYNQESILTITEQINTLFPPWVPNRPFQIPISVEDQDNSFLNKEFSRTELEMVLNQVNKKSSPGIDGIDYLVISHFSVIAREILLELFNKFYFTRNYPQEWKDYIVFFIPKDENKEEISSDIAFCLLT